MPDSFSKSTILIVDDSPENIDVLIGILSDKGYKLKAATNGDKALKIAFSENPPDLILLDIMMPGMNGYDVCRKLKDHPETQSIPVVFISALNATGDIVQGFNSGGADYITKPFQPQEVCARVQTHLQIRDYQLELEQKNNELERNYDSLKELEHQRDNLTGMIVHDMRSPLQIISGFIQLLETFPESQICEQAREHIAVMGKSSKNLIEMVSSLLDVSRLENNKMPLALEPMDMNSIVTKVLANYEGLENIPSLKTNFSKSATEITADPAIMERIINNLIGNACKFTPITGSITISVDSADSSVKVGITDTGCGIPPEHQKKIFEKFGQVELREQKHKYSTGLGLTFCKLAVEAHGGAIGVDSLPGQGSTFWFSLPMENSTLVLNRHEESVY